MPAASTAEYVSELLDHAQDVGSGEPDDTLAHFYCCDKDKSLCGRDLTDYNDLKITSGDPDTCLVCDLLTVCSDCGEVFS